MDGTDRRGRAAARPSFVYYFDCNDNDGILLSECERQRGRAVFIVFIESIAIALEMTIRMIRLYHCLSILVKIRMRIWNVDFHLELDIRNIL